MNTTKFIETNQMFGLGLLWLFLVACINMHLNNDCNLD